VNWEWSDFPILPGVIDVKAADAFADMLGIEVFDPNDPIAALASPVTHVDSGDPPMLLLNGGKDEIVMISQGIRMRDALDSVPIHRTYMELPLHDHDDVGTMWMAPSAHPYAATVVTCTGLNFIAELSSQ
jgi:hypothetical protein